MASTMRAWKNADAMAVALVALLLATAAVAQAAGFSISEFEVRRDKQLLFVDARIDYTLSSAAIEALESGVGLVIVQRLRLQRARSWWRDAVVADLQRRYRLQYHAISRRYVLTRLASGESRSYRSLDALLLQLGRIEAWPVVRLGRLEPGHDYRLRLDTRLALDALPRLLRMKAWIDADWQLRSEPRYRSLTP